MKWVADLALFSCGINAMILLVGAMTGNLGLVVFASISGLVCLLANKLSGEE